MGTGVGINLLLLKPAWAVFGGNARPFELEAFLYAAYELCPFENTIIAWALEDLKVA